MSKHFPCPVLPPDEVAVARASRHEQLRCASWRGIYVRCVVIILELVGASVFGSAVLLVDAAGTVADVLTTLVLLACIALAARPPDEDHPFGHGRYEPLAGLQLGVFLLLAGVLIAGFQVDALVRGEVVYRMDHSAWMIPAGAALLLWWAARTATDTARDQDSAALAAEAMHLRVDCWNSCFAALVLVAASLLPSYAGLLDVVGALLIALGMVVAGVLAAWENIHQIMDRTPDPSYFSRVSGAAKSVSGVLDTEKVRIMRYGPDAHVDIDIEVDPSMRVDDAHAISQHVRAAIQREWPRVRDVTVHIEPYYPGDHNG